MTSEVGVFQPQPATSILWQIICISPNISYFSNASRIREPRRRKKVTPPSFTKRPTAGKKKSFASN